MPYFEEFLVVMTAVVAAIFYAEVLGYVVHKMLHSERFPTLSRAHMLHHLRDYGPSRPARTTSYIYSSEGRASFVGKIGMEWFLPLGSIAAATIGLLWALPVPALFGVTFVVAAIAWGYIGFSYMHAAMHIENFWMLNNRYFRNWFLNVRRLHDIHHNNVQLDGRMMTNFGICFFWVDRILGSLARRPQKDSRKGFEAAHERYSYIYK